MVADGFLQVLLPHVAQQRGRNEAVQAKLLSVIVYTYTEERSDLFSWKIGAAFENKRELRRS